jgi:hypothetical protein
MLEYPLSNLVPSGQPVEIGPSGTQVEPHSQKADPVFITQKTYRAYMFEKLMY